MNRDKVRGMFAGVAIGDALGMPVESWPTAKILQYYPKGITDYVKPVDHKYYAGCDPKTVTDDTQLTVAVAKALIEARCFDLDMQAKHHIVALQESTLGWGGTTREAVRRMANGVHPLLSGQTPEGGMGNGPIMKLAPLAAYRLSPKFVGTSFYQNIVDFAAMTHFNQNPAQAAVIHVIILQNMLKKNSTEVFSWRKDCFDLVAGVLEFTDPDYAGFDAVYYSLSRLTLNDPGLNYYMYKLQDVFENKIPWSQVKAEFGFGNSVAHNSLPFTYAHFAKNPTLAGLYEVINAGGDTDTNASMFASMLGAWHGMSVWTPALLDLPCMPDLLKLADELCDTFGIV